LTSPIVLIPYLFSVSRCDSFLERTIHLPLVRHLDSSAGSTLSITVSNWESCLFIPRRLLPFDALLSIEANREATSPLRRAPPLHVSSSLIWSLLSSAVARDLEVLVRSMLAPLVCVGVTAIREATSPPRPILSLCVASSSPNRLLAPRLPLLEVWRYLRSLFCSFDMKFVALCSCCCVDLCSSAVPEVQRQRVRVERGL
jgi:hypothetical protein